MSQLKILITSVGSLVGQNILDVLESPKMNRRHLVEVVGTNSIAGSANNFRCDSCYLVSNTAEKSFKNQIIDIIEREKPDLILSGRDEDTETMVRIRDEYPELNCNLPYGKVETLTSALNKWKTWLFTNKHNLPYADTFYPGKTGDKSDLKDFINRNKYPLIAKPVQGFASKGVYFVRSWQDIEYISKFSGYIFQEYLGRGEELEEYFKKHNGPVPLFSHAPNIFHHSCHTVIHPDGSFDPIFISRNEHDSGVTIGFKRVKHKELEELTVRYVKAIHSEGGFGPVTVQFRKNRLGAWKSQEMNMRTNGNTYPRFLMGQDDLGLIIKALLPGKKFPIYKAPQESHEYIIGKTLTSYVMYPEKLNNLETNKYRSSTKL